MVRVVSLVAAAGLLLAVASAAQAQGGGTAGLFATAYTVAQNEIPNGTLLRARVEGNLFGYYFWIDGRIVEVEVNKEFKVVKKKDQKDDPSVPQDVLQMLQKKGRAKLPPGRLLEIAADNLKDTPLTSLQFATMKDKLVFQIGDLVLDAETGNVVKK
jgi:hypothetical protein